MNFLLFTIIPGVASFFVMKKEKEQFSEGQIDNTPLSGRLLLYVAVLNLFAPLIAQSIFYYGWKKQLPEKAKKANNIGWLLFLAEIVVFYFLGH